MKFIMKDPLIFLTNFYVDIWIKWIVFAPWHQENIIPMSLLRLNHFYSFSSRY